MVSPAGILAHTITSIHKEDFGREAARSLASRQETAIGIIYLLLSHTSCGSVLQTLLCCPRVEELSHLRLPERRPFPKEGMELMLSLAWETAAAEKCQ